MEKVFLKQAKLLGMYEVDLSGIRSQKKDCATYLKFPNLYNTPKRFKPFL